MSVWRPASQIRVKVIGLHWRAGRLLAAEVPDDSGRIKGVRPLGGTVEFGERAEDALRREFHEELGIAVAITGPAVVLENLFQHEGATGHEVIFAYPVTFPPGAFDGQDVIRFHEDSGTACVARWYDPARLDRPDGPALFPSGLKARLDAWTGGDAR
ncbi:MAG: NUDIX hydrolase [Paracoccus sp. (in: a-proteobacteria)]|nr:NUDIX hydrolase [Paracoccus sp. (in: a-proteobacteria)]